MNDQISLSQDKLSKQFEPRIKDSISDVFLRPLANGDHAIAILNKLPVLQNSKISLLELYLRGKYEIKDLWQHKVRPRLIRKLVWLKLI